MKLLNRLREMCLIDPGMTLDPMVTPVGLSEMDFDEFAFQQGMEETAFYSIPSLDRLDGVRQSMAGRRKEFAPGFMELGNDDGGS